MKKMQPRLKCCKVSFLSDDFFMKCNEQQKWACFMGNKDLPAAEVCQDSTDGHFGEGKQIFPSALP